MKTNRCLVNFHLVQVPVTVQWSRLPSGKFKHRYGSPNGGFPLCQSTIQGFYGGTKPQIQQFHQQTAILRFEKHGNRCFIATIHFSDDI